MFYVILTVLVILIGISDLPAIEIAPFYTPTTMEVNTKSVLSNARTLLTWQVKTSLIMILICFSFISEDNHLFTWSLFILLSLTCPLTTFPINTNKYDTHWHMCLYFHRHRHKKKYFMHGRWVIARFYFL